MNPSEDEHVPDKSHNEKEDRQENKIKDAISEEYRHYVPDSKHKIKELEQTGNISEEISSEYKNKQSSTKKKNLVILLGVIIAFSVFTSSLFLIFLESPEYQSSHEPLKSQFLIQNLRGDKVDTWISWKITEGDLFHVHVMDSKFATEERRNAIIDVIMSTDEIEIDDSLMRKGPKGESSTYYLGWRGALNSITTNTYSSIPKNLHFHVTDKGEGDILIDLSNLSHPEGYSGYTLVSIDEEQHQILKAVITIYDVEGISTEQFKTIIRHELGHGFGLAHSTASEDLMAPVISTPFPYISQCDIDAIIHLYDDGKKSKVVCEK